MFYFKWTLLSLVFFFLASCGIPTPGSEVVAMNSNEISMISNTPITIPPINITSISDDDDDDQSSDLESNSGS